MTTAAERGDEGQSVLEFLLVLPLLAALTMFLIKVDIAIQEGIVDQQYSRAQALYIAGNSPRYPRRSDIVHTLATLKYNQIVVGVSNNYITSGEDSEGDGDNSGSEASIVNIARAGVTGDDEVKKEPNGNRARVRIRNTVTLCLPYINIGGKSVYPDPTQPASNGAPQSALGEQANQFDFCSSPLTYEDS